MKSNGKLCPLGKLVVKALTDQDKTKTQLAAEIGASPQYLSYILYGVRSGEKYLPAIIAALNLDPRKVEKVTAAYDEILAALEDGNTLSEFRSRMNEFLTSEGYEGLDPLQADLIFRTNIQTAYNVGHYEQMTDPGVMKLRPYWQYDAVNDAHTRPSHLAMDGRVFPADSAVWDSWFPPNGFRCRCTVKTLSKRQVEARGLKVEQSAPGGVMPDPHFSTNPAKVRFTPDLKDYPEALVKAYQKREKENPSL